MAKEKCYVEPKKEFSLKAVLNIKWNAIKEKFLELSHEVNCECYPKIFEEDLHVFNKLIWILLFVIFTILTGYLITLNVFDYLRLIFEKHFITVVLSVSFPLALV